MHRRWPPRARNKTTNKYRSTTANKHKKMGNKLWEKKYSVNADVEKYTIGKDAEMDMYIAKYDVIGSMAHATMLESVGLLDKEDLEQILSGLRDIHARIEAGDFKIDPGVEDVHSQVELMLGECGKKLHSGRSRNDQVLVDLKLFIRAKLEETVHAVKLLFDTLVSQSEKYKNVLMPGYTHLQIAMPSSFGLWFGAYAESLADDMQLLLSAYKVANRNPLGSAAGYGNSFPLNRSMTTELLGFDGLNYNVVYAQMGRGKTERIVSQALASVAATISKLSFDCCMFNSQNFGFIKLAPQYTTGSSIMPHKKNPDVFELTRAKCNRMQAIPNDILLITNNLPSGYFRDLQIIKECFLPMFDELCSVLQMVKDMMEKIEVNEHILDNTMYDAIFSVEEVNRLTLNGTPFREAYKKVGIDIEEGRFKADKTVRHTHEGSIGNLCNDKIAAYMDSILAQFPFERVREAEQKLLACGASK